ncbi:hypothetical protein [Ilumatobacter sp.]|uniref:hypothetical protein n=1 Tax=Ilumatobacter sp. TaxID=1967498 RepID=UPI003C490824
MNPGDLVVDVADRELRISMVGGGDWTVPIGPVSLVENELERSDRPSPEQLTNSLGIVTDHLDDVIRESPLVLDAPGVVFVGPHSTTLARVEVGLDDVPTGYTLERPDADEVFRTLVSEARADRIHNPGLDADHVDTIIATCCVVLAMMRRFELSSVAITTHAEADRGES